MNFQHSSETWQDSPELVPGALLAKGIGPDVSITSRLGRFTAIAESRLATRAEGGFPKIQAWRRTFSRMGTHTHPVPLSSAAPPPSRCPAPAVAP